MDDEEEARTRRHARREREDRSGASPAKRKGSAPARAAQEPRLQPLGENETIQERTPSPVARPQAPTPKSAAAAAAEDRKLAPPRGPRPPAQQRTNTSSTDGAPSIVLQEATPTKDVFIESRRSMEPQSPSAHATAQINGGNPLNVPVVHDEQLQHFFNEVANQLNTMNVRSSVTSASSSAQDAMTSDYAAYMPFVNDQPASMQNSPTIEIELGQQENVVDPNQFADADDDETDLASVYSHAPSAIASPQSSPLVGLGFGVPPVLARPGLYPIPAQQQNNRWSYASSNGSSRHPAESIHAYSPQAYSPQTVDLAPPIPMQAHRPAPAPPTASRPAPAPPPKRVEVPKDADNHRTESLLPRDNSYVVIDDADVPASDSSWGSRQSGFSAHRNAQDAFGMLKKKKKVTTIEPVPWMPNLSGPPTGGSTFSAMTGATGATASSSVGVNSPKRSWFNNLFSFKPASCTLLSHDNVANTRERTKRALGDLHVRVAVVEIDGLRALKCRLDEVRDPHTNVTVIKGVRFKVEFSRSNASSSSSTGYNTLVSLTQEKGAQSSFKAIFASLKAILEAPPSSSTQQRVSSGSGTGSAHSSYNRSPQLPPLSPLFSPQRQGANYLPPPSPNMAPSSPTYQGGRSVPPSPAHSAHSNGRFAPSPQFIPSPNLPTAIRL